MRLFSIALLTTAIGCGSATSAPPADEAPTAGARIGAPAPDFTLTDLAGETHRLSDYRGKTVIMEWFNPGCPYVRYAHGEGPLKELAKQTVSDDTVWLAINSGAPGKQGHGAETNRQAAAQWGMEHPLLLDESGEVGKQYDAQTTPHMYIVDPSGVLRYNGALDNAPLGKASGTPVNYVEQALADLRAGREVKVPTSRPYGCSVKYGS